MTERDSKDEFILSADADECVRLSGLIKLRQMQLKYEEVAKKPQVRKPDQQEIGYVQKVYELVKQPHSGEFDNSKVVRVMRDFYVYCYYRDVNSKILIALTIILADFDDQVRADVWVDTELRHFADVKIMDKYY